MDRPKFPWENWITDPKVVERINCLLNDYTNNQVASILNAEGYLSGQGKSFDGHRVRRICRAYGLKSRYEGLREAGMLTRAKLAAMQGVHRATITKWRERGRIKGHLADDQGQFLFENPGEISLRLKKKRNKKRPLNSGSQPNVAPMTKEV